MENQGRVIAVNGPVVRASGMKHFGMREMVHTGDEGLVGEIIRMEGDEAVIQVYEETEGLRPGESVTGTGEPLSISLGPGLLGAIFDGIGRPLGTLLEREGPFLGRGLQVDQIDLSKNWEIAPKVFEGDTLSPGMLLAVVQETSLFQHRILVPPECFGELTFLAPPGPVAGGTEIARLRDEHGREHSLTMIHRWPVRTPRPSRRRLPLHSPLLTGQRVIDGLFPIAKG
ncbi:MAG TPA: V-type ATP synthase subunit A, partial [Synergistaceae bacterium]|nr:V-type ATP synthase subunit A [Synergistaceae bacterium]